MALTGPIRLTTNDSITQGTSARKIPVQHQLYPTRRHFTSPAFHSGEADEHEKPPSSHPAGRSPTPAPSRRAPSPGAARTSRSPRTRRAGTEPRCRARGGGAAPDRRPPGAVRVLNRGSAAAAPAPSRTAPPAAPLRSAALGSRAAPRRRLQATGRGVRYRELPLIANCGQPGSA